MPCPPRLKWLMNSFNKMFKKWDAVIAHTFILHFNVRDVVDGVNHIIDQLMESPMIANREIIINYNRSAGFSFPIPEHKKVLLEELGFSEEETDVDIPGLNDMLPREPEAALSIIEAALRLSRKGEGGVLEGKTAVIIDYAETIAPSADLAQMSPADRTILATIQRWATDKQISALGSPIILVTENLADIHPVLKTASSRIEPVQIPLPDIDYRKLYISGMCEKYTDVQLEGIEVDQMARLTAGLKNLHLEDIFARAEVEGLPVTPELVKERKNEIIASEFGEILQIIEPETDFSDIGGMPHVKEFFRKNVVKPLKEGNTRRCPMGVLLPGPAGTGKTVLAEAIAKESGVNCCMLNLGKIMDKWVGSSESNLDKALTCIEALEPTICVVDEIDQSGLSRDSGGDSGVSNRLFKRLLEFMSDTRHRGKVVFIGLTNRPDVMDAALKRPGRFDKKVPILPPDEEERVDVIKVMLKKYGLGHNLKEADFKYAASQTGGYTGAEIEALVLKAAEVAEDAGKEKMTRADIEYALKVYRPTTRDIEKMTNLALLECNDLDLLPPAYREKYEEKKELQEMSVATGRQRRSVKAIN